MIVNSSISALLRDTPPFPRDWKEGLHSWLKIIDGEDFPPVFAAQLEMIDSLIETEQKIQDIGEQAGILRKAIPEYKLKNEMTRITQTQRQISALEGIIKSLQYRRHCILFLGDVMAIKLLDQDDIKHLSANQPAGFISGKSGLKAEIQAAKDFFGKGYIVVFNDLTHSLTMGDLTLRKGDEIRTFEVKSSRRGYFNRDTFRQITNPLVIHQYMKTDITPVPVTISAKSLKDADFESNQEAAYAFRLDSSTAEIVHFNDVGKLFKRTYKSGVVELRIGAKIYLAALKRNVEALRSKIEETTADGSWIVTNVRKRVTEHRDLPPFGFWFRPQSTVDVISGDIIVLSAFSMEDLTNQFDAKRIKLTWKRRNGDIFPMYYEPQFPIESPFELQNRNINQWHWLRVLYSFLSLETFVGYCAEMFSPEYVAQVMTKIKEVEQRNSRLRAGAKESEDTDRRNHTQGEAKQGLSGIE